MPPSHSLLLSRRDLDFLLYDWLGVDALVSRERFAEHSRESFDSLLDLAAEIAAECFAPHNKRNDAEEPRLEGDRVVLLPEVKKALDVLADAGLVGTTLDDAVGGMQLPHVVAAAYLAWFQAANIGTSSYSFLTNANAALICAHGSPEQVEAFVRPWSRDASTGPCACPNPRPAPPSPTSRPGPSRRPTARTVCSATRCGSRAATTSSARTSCTSCWRRSPAGRRG
jgi:butyryl-CoA dehydrogenase